MGRALPRTLSDADRGLTSEQRRRWLAGRLASVRSPSRDRHCDPNEHGFSSASDARHPYSVADDSGSSDKNIERFLEFLRIRQPHVAAFDQRLLVRWPVANAILVLVLRIDLRSHVEIVHRQRSQRTENLPLPCAADRLCTNAADRHEHFVQEPRISEGAEVRAWHTSEAHSPPEPRRPTAWRRARADS